MVVVVVVVVVLVVVLVEPSGAGEAVVGLPSGESPTH